MRKQYDCIRLHFTSPLHLSRGREYYDESVKVLHSDTIAAALFVAALRLGAREDEALAMLDGCRLSSAFPFYDCTHFFPKPMARLPFSIQGVKEENSGKLYKKIQYLDQLWFERMLAGEEQLVSPEKHLTQKGFLSEHENPVIFKPDVVQRVTIPPDNIGDPVPFFTERLFFGKKAGLFVLVEWEDLAVKELFFKAFRLLGDLGIGTDRSTGNGFFYAEMSQLELALPENATHQCSLGLYLPGEGELQDPDLMKSSWALVKRGGYIAGASDEAHISLRKRSVYMFQEGAVFPNKSLVGKRVDLRPNWENLHPVWREGRPIFLPAFVNAIG